MTISTKQIRLWILWNKRWIGMAVILIIVSIIVLLSITKADKFIDISDSLITNLMNRFSQKVTPQLPVTNRERKLLAEYKLDIPIRKTEIWRGLLSRTFNDVKNDFYTPKEIKIGQIDLVGKTITSDDGVVYRFNDNTLFLIPRFDTDTDGKVRKIDYSFVTKNILSLVKHGDYLLVAYFEKDFVDSTFNLTEITILN